jgi:phospholipid/cholesterol/gamma-HCH transport system ATP-binding protein
VIEALNITKSFHGNTVLQDVSVSFEPGQVSFIIGRSGSGKSVLTKCLVGLFEVDAGQVFFNDRNFTSMDRWQRKDVRKDVGMLFQGSALFDSLTVEQNVMFPLDMFSNYSKEEKMERVNFCLKRVNLENKNKLFPSELSGGMKKRTGIARAIAMNPKYLFCDEPNSGLDPQTSIVIDNLIKDITNEFQITTVVVSHDMNSVMEIGDKIYFIHQGKKWWTGSRSEILITDNKELNDFIFPSGFMKEIRENLRRKQF